MKTQSSSRRGPAASEAQPGEASGPAVRERPILFSAPMVRALLAGTKTQTRRVVKPAPPPHTVAVGRWQDPPGYDAAYWAFVRKGPVEKDHPFAGAEIHGEPWRCPYGVFGDRLWVRESLCLHNNFGMPLAPLGKPAKDGGEYADGGWRVWSYAATPTDTATVTRKVPSIHMPHWASRILLEVTGLRIERLQDISGADAKAEGCEPIEGGIWWKNYAYPLGFDGKPTKVVGYRLARESYRSLWESINGPRSWDRNDWVWVVEFKRVAP